MKKFFLLFLLITPLFAATPATTNLMVSWDDNSTGETGFIVQRTYVGGTSGWETVGTVGPNTTVYVDKGVANQTCWYRVAAVNDTLSLQSDWSDPVYYNPATATPAPVLNKPGNVAVQQVP